MTTKKERKTINGLQSLSSSDCMFLEWKNCYTSEKYYNKYFDKSTLKHPAKMSFHLLQKIFDHLEEQFNITDDTTIVDFMAGSGRTSLVSALRGYSSLNIELEQDYIDMQNKNKQKLEQTLGNTGITIVQGDSKSLGNIIWNSKYSQNNLAGIISPPYEDAEIPQFDADLRKALHSDKGKRSVEEMQKKRAELRARQGWEGYNVKNQNNIGNLKGDDYQKTMTHIYKEAYKAKISPLVVVTKNPTRNKKLVDLASNTAQYLEDAGYRIADYHRARLFNKQKTEQSDLFPNSEEKIKGRVSFFKRLSIEKGNVAAEWEDIIFAVVD